MSQKQDFSDEEKKYYDNIYQRILQKKQNKITANYMVQFMLNRSNVKEQRIAEFMVQQAVNLSDSNSSNIKQEGFRIMMKYLGQYQSGVNVEQIDILKVKNTSFPKFPKQQIQEKIERNKQSKIYMSKIDQSKLVVDDEQEESKDQPNLQAYKKYEEFKDQPHLQPYQNNKYQDITMSIHEQRYPILNTNKIKTENIVDQMDKLTIFQEQNQIQKDQTSTLQELTNKKPEQIHIQQHSNNYKEQQQQKQQSKNNQNNNRISEEGIIQELETRIKEEYNSNLSMLKSINFPEMSQYITPQSKDKKKPTIQINRYELKEHYIKKNYFVFFIQYGQSSETVERRYKQFEELNSYFLSKKEYSGRIIPKLPPKQSSLNYIFQTESSSDEFMQKRMNDLEDYLDRINQLSYLSEDSIFNSFITEKTFEIPSEHQKSIITQVGQMLHTIKSHNFQENSQYFQVLISQKLNEYFNSEEHTLINTKEIDDVMQQINAYQKQVDHLQQIFYQQYKMEKQKVDITQSFPESVDILDSISYLEKSLLTQSSNYGTVLILKKSIWKDFRSISLQIDGAKQSYDLLLQKIKNQHFLNHLRAIKLSSNERDNPTLKQKLQEIDQGINDSEEDISKNKTLLRVDLDNLLKNLKKKIRESLEYFKKYTLTELGQE